MQHNISAFTEPQGSCPGYVSINRHDDGTYSISVRSAGEQSPSTINLTPQQLDRIGQDIYFLFHNGSGG